MKHCIPAALAFPFLLGCQADPPAGNEVGGAAIANDAIPTPAEKSIQPGNVPARASQFTLIDPEKCKLLEQNIEEGGWSRWLCEGFAGYRLELTDSDLRQDIVIIPANGQREELGLTEIVANGAFNALGKTAEWRGSDPSSPDVLIVRLGVAVDPEGKRPDVSNLVVARLKPSACIVAVVPPRPGQNERARAIADDALPDCLRR